MNVVAFAVAFAIAMVVFLGFVALLIWLDRSSGP